jgi:hypothetical protein
MEASSDDRRAVVRLLLEAGADIEAKDKVTNILNAHANVL